MTGLAIEGSGETSPTSTATTPSPLTGPTTSDSSLLAFYEDVLSFNESTVHPTCCTISKTPFSTTCGQGRSCAASCFAQDASLCPSNNCEACDNFEEEPDEEGRSIATLGSSFWKWCPSKGCRVGGRSRGCCFNAVCNEKRPKKCAWLQYFAGNSCPRPGRIGHGQFSCTQLEIPIGDTPDINGEMETYKTLQCRLDCDAGYVSDLSPVITCVEGSYDS